MLLRDQVDLSAVTPSPLDTDLSSGPKLTSHEGSGSGGYAHHVFISAAKQLFDKDSNQLEWKTMRWVVGTFMLIFFFLFPFLKIVIIWVLKVILLSMYFFFLCVYLLVLDYEVHQESTNIV